LRTTVSYCLVDEYRGSDCLIFATTLISRYFYSKNLATEIKTKT
jgi:hypothetical protein